MNRIILSLSVFLSCFPVYAQQFDVPAGSVSLEPRGTATGETGQVRWYELVANGRERVTLKAPDALAASIDLTWFSALPGGSAVAICVDSTGLLTTGCASGASSGAAGAIQLSDGAGGLTSAATFAFDTATSVLSLPGDIDTVTHREFTLSVADSGFFTRRALWVDSSDNITIGLENALGGNLKLRAGLGPSGKYTLTMPDAAPADASGNNFLKFATSGVGSWDAIAAVDVANNTTVLAPRGVLNFGASLTAADALTRIDVAINGANTNIWTAVQQFDAGIAGKLSGGASDVDDVGITGYPMRRGLFREYVRADSLRAGSYSEATEIRLGNPDTASDEWRLQDFGGDMQIKRPNGSVVLWLQATTGNPVTPAAAGSTDLGTPSVPFGAIYAEDLDVSGNVTLTVGAGNFYTRDIGGASTTVSCSGVANGWLGISDDFYVVMCYGGVRYRAALSSF